MIAVFSRYMRASTLDNLPRTTSARPAPAVPGRSPSCGACLPQLPHARDRLLGYYVPVLFGGALVVEQLFNYPGMGLLFWSAAQSSDYPVLLGCVLVISVATVIGTLLADIVQRIVDPE